MRKFNIVLLLIVILILTGSGFAWASEPVKQTFNDIPAGSTAASYVDYLNYKGIIKGYPDGSYRPNQGLTRAEAAAVICNAASVKPDNNAALQYRDIKNNYWARGYIMAATKAGYLRGDSDNTFRPEQVLTRAEALTLLWRLSRTDLTPAVLPVLEDVNSKHWAARQIAAGLAAGMVRLTPDGKKFMPDAPFTRLNMSEALGVLLTQDPMLASVSLNGTIKPLKGKVTLKRQGSSREETVTQNIPIVTGDMISTGSDGKAEIDYPDGSSLLLKADSQIIFKATEGRKYIKTDGTEGIAVDWLNLDLKKGTMFAALATRHEEGTSSPADNTSKVSDLPTTYCTLASLDNDCYGMLAAATVAKKPWYVAAQTKRVKVQVDMPWGVASVRGTFVLVNVNENGQSQVSCLTGSAEVTNGGVTVPLTANQATQVTQQQLAPPPAAPIAAQAAQEFAQEAQWVQQTAQIMDAQREAAPLSLPGAVNLEASPSTQVLVQQALTAVGGTNNQGAVTSDRGHSSSLSSNTAITSSVYNIAGSAISNVPADTSKSTFLANLSKGDAYQMWNSDSVHDPVTSGDTLGVTAENGTKATYTVTVNMPLSSNTAIASSVYNIAGSAISNIPYGTSKESFIAKLFKGDAYQTWNTEGIHDPVTSGDTLGVTAENGTKATYTVTVNNPSGNTDITSEYNIAGSAISNVPYGTSKESFIAKLFKGDAYQTWNTEGIHDPVTSGDTLVVTAQNGAKASYTITVDNPSGNTDITSSKYNIAGSAIYNVPVNTSKATFLANLGKGDAYQIWNTGGIHDWVTSGDTLVVTAQNGNQVIYTIPDTVRQGQSFSDSVPTNINLSINIKLNPLTIEAWVRPQLRTDDAVTPNNNFGIHCPNNVISNDAQGPYGRGFGVNVWQTGSEMITETTSGFRKISGVSVIPGQWYHIAVVYTEAAGVGNAKTYINGIIVDDFSYGETSPAGVNIVRIGRHNDDVGWSTRRYFNGGISDVRLWSKELTANDLLQSMNSGVTGTELGLIGYWNGNK